MDILRVLAFNNDKVVRETVVSSIFNYLLDPYNDHGFGSTFLVRYLRGLECSWITEELIKALEAYGKNHDLVIQVSPEWSGVSSQAPDSRRRLDSLIRIEYRGKLYLIGTEVKIYPTSASDDVQLDAYVEMLSTERAVAIEEGEYPVDSIKMDLAYLIPANARGPYDFADATTAKCLSIGIDGIRVMTWQAPDASKVSLPKVAPVCKISMEEIIRELLESYASGDVSPVDAHAADLVRSLRSAAIKKFDFSMPSASVSRGRFPDSESYEKGLDEYQRSLLECFKMAAKLFGCKRPIGANSQHTSIGIPAIEAPAPGKNNTLCRIVTTLSYDTAVPVDGFVLQISQPVYEKQLETIKVNLGNLVIPHNLKLSDDGGKPLYHENGKKDQPVFLITFPGSGANLDDDKRIDVTGQFAVLLDTLKRVFLAEAR